MLRAIWGSNASRHEELFEDIWRFRHRNFVERFGWEDLRNPDGLERDQFDTDAAIHLPLFDGDRLVAYSRLLPTAAPHLLSDVYPELAKGRSWPRGEGIYEWTRVAAENAGYEDVLASHAVMTAGLEYLLTIGVSKIIGEAHPRIIEAMVTSGWEITPIASPSLYSGQLVLPIIGTPTPRALLQHHDMYRINGSLIDFSNSDPNPLKPHEPLKLLPYLEGPHGRQEMRRIAGE